MVWAFTSPPNFPAVDWTGCLMFYGGSKSEFKHNISKYVTNITTLFFRNKITGVAICGYTLRNGMNRFDMPSFFQKIIYYV